MVDIQKYLNSESWNEKAFTVEKAYVCSALAEMAYWHVPKFELEDAKRINIIPCDAYKAYHQQGSNFDLKGVLRSMDLGRVVILERKYAVIVVVSTPQVTFVSIRGTKYLYDWLINLNVLRQQINTRRKLYFHRGFYRAILSCFPAIDRELEKIITQSDGSNSKSPRVPIYVTGHSLGGALAAIMHSYWDMRLPSKNSSADDEWIQSHSSYTFGMPRYGNLNYMRLPGRPYHIYNEADIVPTVPPRIFGYDNCFEEYRLDGTEIEQLSERDGVNFIIWITRLITGKGIANHSIELYRERLHDWVQKNESTQQEFRSPTFWH